LRISKLAEQEGQIIKLKEVVADVQRQMARLARLPPEETVARKEVDRLTRDLEYFRKELDGMRGKEMKE